MSNFRFTSGVPREALTGTALGTVLMAFFTVVWAAIANFGLHGADHHLWLFSCSASATGCTVYGIYLYVISRRLSAAKTPDDRAQKKQKMKWFGIIFGLEGLMIPVAVNFVIWIGHQELIFPAIALVVGLHFFPMARLFNRKIDFWLASWSCLIALVGVICGVANIGGNKVIAAFTGMGMSLTTLCYAGYMIRYSQRLLKQK